jgi:hypothetical protein
MQLNDYNTIFNYYLPRKIKFNACALLSIDVFIENIILSVFEPNKHFHFNASIIHVTINDVFLLHLFSSSPRFSRFVFIFIF